MSRTNAERVALLLELLAEPTTPETHSEVLFRVKLWRAHNELWPHLRYEDPNIVRLVLNVLDWEARAADTHDIAEHVDELVQCLSHADRLVRQSATNLLGSLGTDSDAVVDGLRVIMMNEEPYIANEATIALLRIRPGLASELVLTIADRLNGDNYHSMWPLLYDIELLGRHVEAVLPRLKELAVTEETAEQSSFAILRSTGDTSFVDKLIAECDSEGLATEYQQELEEILDLMATRDRQLFD